MPDTPFGVYLILDRAVLGRRKPVHLVPGLIEAGIRWFQYRDKTGTDEEVKSELARLIPLCRSAGAKLILNDRVWLAEASGSDGAHIGGADMSVLEARALLGASAIIGRSAHSPAEARAAERDGADYIGAGAVYRTATKADVVCIGLDGLAEICRSVSIPVVAVGGINRSNIAHVVEAGAAGAAVASAVLSAPDPAAAARELIAEIERCRKK